MTRVLVVDEELPWPLDSGKRIRTMELLRRLAGEFEVRLLFPRDPAVPDEALAAVAETGVRPFPVPRRAPRKRGLPFAWACLANLFSTRPYMAAAHRSRTVSRRVADQVRSGGIDLVHVEWTPLVENVPEGLDVPVCVTAHNVESEVFERAARNETSLPRRAYLALQARKVARHEAACLSRADAVIAVAERDAVRLRERLGPRGPRVTVVENGVDASRFAPPERNGVEPSSLVFVGSLDWRPNQDAAVWFADEVFPRIRARRPDARFSVVGRSPPPWLVRRLEGRPGVALHASVADVRPHVGRAAACVVPLRVGGGSRLKICEALAMGRPVVSTSVGAEGLAVDGGVEIADGAGGFAAAVERVLSSPEDAAARARRGREAVLARHEWGRLARLQGDLWRSLAERRR
jgi:glycosyltransferase involved in cell wall biosynthesis